MVHVYNFLLIEQEMNEVCFDLKLPRWEMDHDSARGKHVWDANIQHRNHIHTDKLESSNLFSNHHSFIVLLIIE